MKKITFLLLFTALISSVSWAQLSIDAASTDYSITFDATVTNVSNGQFQGAGFQPSPTAGQLDSDAWATTGMSDGALNFGGTNTSGDHARGSSTGGVSTGGFYAFDIGSGDYILGVQPGGSDWTPGTVTLKLFNNTGTTITSIDIEYDIETYNDQGRANSLNFSHSSDDVTYTSISALDFTTPEVADGSPSWQNTFRSTTITGLSIADGANYYLRWEGDDVSGSGSRDEYGFHNIVVNATTGASNSAESDIVKTSGWSEPTNIDYTLYSAASGLTTSNAIEVGKFTIRDGGATAPDSDSESTSLTSVTFSINNSSEIQALALFDGTTNVSEETSVSSTTTFSSITGLAAADDGTKDFSVYATFKTNVTDNVNIKFTIISASADAAGSTFAAGDAGGAATDDTGDNNKLVVTADRLAITTPSSVVINTDFNVDVEATDANGSRDLDEISSVTLALASGTGTLSSVAGLTQNLASGYYQWTDVQYDVAEDFTIEAQSATLTNATSGTITAQSSVNTDLIISEVADPKDVYQARFVEIYNAGTTSVDFSSITWYLCKQSNGGSWNDIQLSGSITAGGKYVVAYSASSFTTAYGFAPDQSSGSISGNGDDGYFLYYNGTHTTGTLIDSYGVIDLDGTGEAWEYTDTKAVRLRSVTAPNTTWMASEWDIPGVANTTDMTPGAHAEDISWQGTTSTDWNTKGTNWPGTYGYIPDASFNVSVPSVTNLPVISAASACNDLTVQSAASLTVSVNNGLTVYGNLDATSGTLTVQSDATGNGSIIVEGTATGDVTVERYMVGYDVADNGWHNIGSPVDDMLISGSDFDPTGTNDDLYQWNESTELWENYKQNHFTNFVNGKGYLSSIETTDTRNFVGTLNTADYTQSGLTKDVLGFNMLGNPYASALVWNNGDWTLTNVGAVAQIWEEINGSYTAIAADGIIPSTNGFFVEVATVAGGSVTIPASARIHNTTSNYKNVVANNYEETLDLKVTNDENMFYDITRVAFKDDATEAWDIQYDAHKLFGGSTTSQLWSVMGDENFVFNYLPYVYESYQLPIHFRAGVNATHHINVSGIESFFGNSGIYLEDLKTGDLINLSEQQMYTFTASTEDDEARFILHFSGITTVGEEMLNDDVQIYANGNSVYFRFERMPKEDTQVSVFNTIGQKVYAGEVGQSTLSSIRLNEKPGIYIVRLQSEEGTTTQKVMIK